MIGSSFLQKDYIQILDSVCKDYNIDLGFSIRHKCFIDIFLQKERFINVLSKKLDDAKSQFLDNVIVFLIYDISLQIHKKLYYENNQPIVTDHFYDNLENIRNDYYYKIKNNDKYKEFIEDINYEIQVGYQPSSSFQSIAHKKPMLSLEKVFIEEDLFKFDKRVKRFLNISEIDNTDIAYSAELKIDGLSLSLRYEDGALVQALTRGDGKIGEDVTENIKVITEIPKQLTGTYPDILEVRGEIYINKEDFIKVNINQQAKGERLFANPRNLASGSLRTLNTEITKNRNLRFIGYGFGEVSDNYLSDSLYENINKLSELGFKIGAYNRKYQGVENLLKYHEFINSIRSDIPYDIDGVVYKLDSITYQDRLGSLLNVPKWAVAHKFQAEEAITKVENILIQVGRTGVLTPLAELQPVNIGGAVVSRASLHNRNELEKKDIRIGDTVNIKRAGDIIPQVISVILEKRPENASKFVFPIKCPVCNSPTTQLEGEVAIRCSGGKFFCEAMILESFYHFVSKKAFNIEGLADKQIDLFYKLGFLKTPADIWDLKSHVDTLKKLDGFGDKSINKLLKVIESKKQISLDKFIYALGVNKIGEKTSKVLAKYFKEVSLFINCFVNRHKVEITGLGSITLNELNLYFENDENISVTKQLLNIITVLPYEEELSDSDLLGKNILFTGSLETISREEAKSLAERKGAIILSSVSSKLDYLVVGNKPGSKLKKAQELSITVLQERDFINLVNS